jgi:hypothetical protein
MLPGFLML